MIVAIIALSLAVHGWVLATTTFGVHRDEFLYLSMGRHLRLWRMDFPPLIALLANASRGLFDSSLAVVRVFPAIEGAVLLLVSALIARALGGGRFAQALAMLGVLCGPVFQRASTLFQPVVLDQLWWTLGLYALIRLARDDEPRYWLWFGATMGLGLLTKFSILFFGFSVLVALVITPSRRWLRTRWPWLAALVALAIGSPSIVGQLRLGFPVLGQMQDLQSQQLGHVSWWSFVHDQPLMVGVLSFALALVGGWALVASRRWAGFRLAGWTCVIAFALLFALHGKAYYIAPIYPALIATGATVLESLGGRVAGLARVIVVAGVVAFGVIALPIGMPILGWDATARYAARLGVTQALTTNRGVMDKLPQDFADMIGWEEQARALGSVARTLSPSERAQAVIFGDNYGEAGAAEFYRSRYDLPPVVSAAGTFWFFGPGTRPGAVLITIGSDSADLVRYYGDVRRGATVESPWSVDEERVLPIYVARAPTTTLQALWPSLAGRH
jgi:hypothetical protein